MNSCGVGEAGALGTKSSVDKMPGAKGWFMEEGDPSEFDIGVADAPQSPYLVMLAKTTYLVGAVLQGCQLALTIDGIVILLHRYAERCSWRDIRYCGQACRVLCSRRRVKYLSLLSLVSAQPRRK